LSDKDPPETIRTPWGHADRLKERMLRPGPGLPREAGMRNQLERLFGAMVASVAEKGYEGTTVADLLRLSGVSRSTFYNHFSDKQDCFMATFEALLATSVELVTKQLDEEKGPEENARQGTRLFFEQIAQMPAAATLCYNEPYALGPPGHEVIERAMASFAPLLGETLTEINGEELPADMIRGLLGGVQLIIQIHLRRGEQEALPDLTDQLIDWALSYEPPPLPLRLAGRLPRQGETQPPPYVAYSPPERIIRALAAVAGERGYPAMTIAEIASRASMSQATFYAHFADKEEALLAALDSAALQALAVMLPASRRAPDWPNALRAGIGALCHFGAAEPDFARMAAVETYAAGTDALEMRDRSIERMRVLMKPGLMLNPGVPLIVADAIIGAVWGLLYKQIVTKGPQSMPEMAPLASYMALAPFIGAEEAAEVANGDGRGKRG
jgi:AcrR family transcriptional regulator